LSAAAGSVAARIHGIAAQDRQSKTEPHGKGRVLEARTTKRISSAGVWRTRFATAGEPGRLSSSKTRARLIVETLEQIKNRAELAARGGRIDIVFNPGPSQQSSLLIDNVHAAAVAQFLRDHPALTFDYCSNATGVDWLDRVIKKTAKVKTVVDGVEKEVD